MSRAVERIEWIKASEVLSKISDRLLARLAGPYSEQYASIATRLENFEATSYEPTVAHLRTAVLDLAAIAKRLREVDQLVGEAWEKIDGASLDWRTNTPPTIEPPNILSCILQEYCPSPMPIGLDNVTAVLDNFVITSYNRKLCDDISLKPLAGLVWIESRRLGILPGLKKKEKDVFVEQLIDYIKTFMM